MPSPVNNGRRRRAFNHGRRAAYYGRNAEAEMKALRIVNKVLRDKFTLGYQMQLSGKVVGAPPRPKPVIDPAKPKAPPRRRDGGRFQRDRGGYEPPRRSSPRRGW